MKNVILVLFLSVFSLTFASNFDDDVGVDNETVKVELTQKVFNISINANVMDQSLNVSSESGRYEPIITTDDFEATGIVTVSISETVPIHRDVFIDEITNSSGGLPYNCNYSNFNMKTNLAPS